MKIKAISTIVFSVILVGCNDVPKTYEDCILHHLDKVKTKNTVGLLHKACRGKFPLPKENEAVKPAIKKESVEFLLPDDFNFDDFKPNKSTSP